MVPELSIIIVNYNTEKLLMSCLNSIYKNVSDLVFEIIVIDNNSNDSSAEMVKNDFPQIHLIESRKNLGFVKANNLGAQKARGKYILLLNSDTEVTEEGFSAIINFMNSSPDAAIVGGKIFLTNNAIQDSCRRFPTLISEFFNQTTCLVKYFNPFAYKLNMLNFDHNEIIKVDWVTGAYMFIRKSIIDDIGLFDPAIFMYFEDTDFCFRAKKAGYNVYFVPFGKIYHYHGGSSKKILARTVAYCFLSSIVFFKKKYSLAQTHIYKFSVIFVWRLLKHFLNLIRLIYKNKNLDKKLLLFNDIFRELNLLPETFEDY